MIVLWSREGTSVAKRGRWLGVVGSLEGEAFLYFSVELGDGFFLGGNVGDAKGEHGAANIAPSFDGGFDSPGEVVAAFGEAGSRASC